LACQTFWHFHSVLSCLCPFQNWTLSFHSVVIKCDTLYFSRWVLQFRTNVLPPSSRWNDRGSVFLCTVPKHVTPPLLSPVLIPHHSVVTAHPHTNYAPAISIGCHMACN
jgi:hypothetical protein